MIKAINSYSKVNIPKQQTTTPIRKTPSFKSHLQDSFEITTKTTSKRPISFLKDIEYRKNLAKAIDTDPINIANVMGVNELKWLLENMLKKENFMPGKENTNVKNGIFVANLHNHTSYSDGKFSAKELLDAAKKHSENIQKPVFFSVTDHNKIDANRDIIKLISKEPEKYQNVYFIPGVEILSNYLEKPNKKVWFETLVYGLNPFDKKTKEFINIKDFYIPDGRRSFPLEEIGKFFNKNTLMSVAHPQRIITENIDKKEFFKVFKENGGKGLEAYYTYSETQNEDWAKEYPTLSSNDDNEINEIVKFCERFGFVKTGGRDCHGKSFFNRRDKKISFTSKNFFMRN